MNDGVDKELCSLQYASIDDASSTVLRLGRFSELAKIDIASAYRIVPVHPEDRPLLGMKWKGALFVDMALPFCLRSAPKTFTVVADGLKWILQQKPRVHANPCTTWMTICSQGHLVRASAGNCSG